MKRDSSMTVAVIMAVLIMLVCILRFHLSQNDTEPDGNSESMPVSGSLVMPDITQVSQSDEPMLWDFLYGCVGRHTDIDMTRFPPSELVVVTDMNNPTALWVSLYMDGEDFHFPILGTEPECVTLTESQSLRVTETAQKMSSHRVIQEGKWTFLFLDTLPLMVDGMYDALNNYGEWAGVRLDPDPNDHGLMWEDVYMYGGGFPTEWVRKPEWAAIALGMGYDMNDPFWDDWNVMGCKQMGMNGTVEALVQVEQLDAFSVNMKGKTLVMSEKDLNRMIKMKGWVEIPW